jgi:hypothetical protein
VLEASGALLGPKHADIPAKGAVGGGNNSVAGPDTDAVVRVITPGAASAQEPVTVCSPCSTLPATHKQQPQQGTQLQPQHG